VGCTFGFFPALLAHFVRSLRTGHPPRYSGESLPNPVLLTDDLAARETATTNGIEPHGTVGVIAYGANRGTIDIDEAIELMRELQSSTSLYVSDAVVEAGVRELREE